MLWGLALAHNPDLQRAAAEFDAARGRLIQAGRYPNPRFVYEHEELGTRSAPAGAFRVQVTQEILTARKRHLDLAIAARGTDDASVRLVGRTFEILTRVRRAYYDYMASLEVARVQEEIVGTVEQSVAITRDLVGRARTRPPADLLRVEALREEAAINRTRSRLQLRAAWRQLAAEAGVPNLPPPAAVDALAEPVPQWTDEAVLSRVLAVHPDLRQAQVQAEQARLEIDRARAEAVPNVTVGGGYSRNFPENEEGAVLSLEAPLPLWDRKQGRIYEAQARLRQALATQRSTADRLVRETAASLAAYQAARVQVARLQTQVLPRLQESLDLVRQGYRAGSNQITFADVFQAEETLNNTRLRLAEARRELWRAVADLKGLMLLDLGPEWDDTRCVPPITPPIP